MADEFRLENERTYYEQESLWNRPLDAANQNRVEATLRMIPGDIETVLDVGCGRGAVTNRLPGKLTVTAVDLSATALKRVDARIRRVQGSGLQLPFPDESFDLVLASEVIEHFPDAEQEAILAELKRVARRAILIGVPADEDIDGGTVTCGTCGTRYHLNHHHRSYTDGSLRQLTGWPLGAHETCGGVRATVHPLLRALGRSAGGVFETPHGLCPKCNSPYRVAPNPVARLLLKGANTLWRYATGRQALLSHWIALYLKPAGRAA